MSSKSKNFGLSVLLKLYDKKLLFKGALYPMLISILIMCLLSNFSTVDLPLIKMLVNTIISIMPSLLGFVLSGYALLIGFGNIERIAKAKTQGKITLYQKISTVFAIGLLMQISLIVVSFIVLIVTQIPFPPLTDFKYIAIILNYIVAFFLLFGFLYNALMIKDLIINIFNYSQLQHLFINYDKDNKNKEKE